MSTVDKMLIKGIRSFDQENKNVITFFKPLTLIVGPNGAGKTHLTEALCPLSREKDKLQNDLNNLKVKLEREYEEQKKRLDNYERDIDSLLRITLKIKDDLKKGDRLEEAQERLSVSDSQLQSCETRKQEISTELNDSKNAVRDQDTLRRKIEDNLNYRKTKADVDQLSHEIESFEERILKSGGISSIETELVKLAQEKERLIWRLRGTLSVYQGKISKNKIDLKQAQYKDIDKRYFDQLIQLKTSEMANKNLDRYYNALDK